MKQIKTRNSTKQIISMKGKRKLSTFQQINKFVRERVAYHEAGHAIIIHHLRPEAEILEVVISKNPIFEGAKSYYPIEDNGESAGVVVYKCDHDHSPFDDIDAIFNLAGFAAEKLFFSSSARRADSCFDYKRVRNYIHTLEPKMQAIHRKKLKCKTDQLVFEYREEIEILAKLLIKKGAITGDDIKYYIDKCYLTWETVSSAQDLSLG